jgi:hypothetical protein
MIRLNRGHGGPPDKYRWIFYSCLVIAKILRILRYNVERDPQRRFQQAPKR